MSSAFTAVTILGGIVGIGSLAGFYAGSRHKMDLEQWAVAGRGLGVVFVWLLMAGEIYTTFTFLGASGWAYSRGGPALYILAYMPLAYSLSFFILPPVWELGRKYQLQTQPDFFQLRYGNKWLSGFVALIGAIFIIPYLQLQLVGLGIIVEIASFGGVHRAPAIVAASALLTGFVLLSGVRGVAWVSVLKDALLLFAAVFVAIAIPRIYFGGFGPMFSALTAAKPTHLLMPGATTNLGHAWYVSSVFLSATGFYMWPQTFGACFTARNSDILRRNAIVLPFYNLTMPLMFIVGCAAVLIVPGLSNGDLSLLTVVRQTFPAWFLGIIGGAGALTAMVPASIQVLTAATLLAKNVVGQLATQQMSGLQTARVAKIMVIAIMAVAVVFAILTHISLVSLLLLGYSGVTQFLPGIVLGLFWKRASASAVSAGLVVGISLVALLGLTGRDPFFGVNAGFIALCANFALVVALSYVLPSKSSVVGDEDMAISASLAPSRGQVQP
jgi:SSS family solute:Na+ symporter